MPRIRITAAPASRIPLQDGGRQRQLWVGEEYDVGPAAVSALADARNVVFEQIDEPAAAPEPEPEPKRKPRAKAKPKDTRE